MQLRKLSFISVMAFALMNLSALACGTCAPCKAKKAEAAKKACCGKCGGDKAKAKKACATKDGCKSCKAHSHAKGIDTKALAAKVKEAKGVIILDARSGKFDDGKRIPGAKQLAPTADDKTIAAIAGADKKAEIITYCSNTKCGASAKLAAKLKAAGYTNVTEYPVGIKGWTEAGNKVDEVKK